MMSHWSGPNLPAVLSSPNSDAMLSGFVFWVSFTMSPS